MEAKKRGHFSFFWCDFLLRQAYGGQGVRLSATDCDFDRFDPPLPICGGTSRRGKLAVALDYHGSLHAEAI
jgi:hypothetical protein